jgi:hypothetical protein
MALNAAEYVTVPWQEESPSPVKYPQLDFQPVSCDHEASGAFVTEGIAKSSQSTQ